MAKLWRDKLHEHEAKPMQYKFPYESIVRLKDGSVGRIVARIVDRSSEIKPYPAYVIGIGHNYKREIIVPEHGVLEEVVT